MSMTRKMARAAEQRAKAEKRLKSRPDRRAEPQRRAERRAEQTARIEEQRAWLASLTPEERERYNRREDERVQRMMEICAPALIGALGMAVRG